MTLDGQQLVAYIDDHYRAPGDRLYRLEQLPFYADNADDLRRWRAGETEPDWDSAWARSLAEEKAQGLVSQRVRVLSEHLTDDERAACALAYPSNARYEDIRILHRGEHDIPAILEQIQDHWLMERATGDLHLLVMHYDDSGRFVEASESDLTSLYVTARDAALAAAEPWATWWPKHADLARRTAA